MHEPEDLTGEDHRARRLSLSRFDRRAKRITSVVLGAALIALGALLTSHQTGRGFVIATAVLGSLIAAIILGIANVVVFDDPARDARQALSRLGHVVGHLEAVLPVLEQSQRNDILAIKPKRRYSKNDWLRILIDAHEELLLVGHTLDKWCTDDIAPQLCSAIERLVRQGKQVRLLMLSESGDRVPAQRGKTYDERIRKTLRVLAYLHATLPEDARRHLCVHKLKEDVEMPYMAVANERILITAPYPATSQASDAMPALTVGARSEIANAIREDINSLLDRHADLIPLNL